MKKTSIAVLCLLLSSVFAGCGKKQDCRLLEKASPDTSAMTLYCFDGDTTTVKWLYDSEKERTIIEEINRLKTRKEDPARIADWEVPCYGLEITDEDGYDIWLTYSSGLWLLKDGSVYRADYGFPALFDSIPDDDSETDSGGFRMVNSAILGQYDLRFLKKEDFPDLENGISLSFVSYENGTVTVSLRNDSEESFCYGTYFSLQKEIGGEWYTLPVRMSNVGFTDIGLILEPGQSREELCSLSMYGDLESGRYRIEKEGLSAEFEVK